MRRTISCSTNLVDDLARIRADIQSDQDYVYLPDAYVMLGCRCLAFSLASSEMPIVGDNTHCSVRPFMHELSCELSELSRRSQISSGPEKSRSLRLVS